MAQGGGNLNDSVFKFKYPGFALEGGDVEVSSLWVHEWLVNCGYTFAHSHRLVYVDKELCVALFKAKQRLNERFTNDNNQQS